MSSYHPISPNAELVTLPRAYLFRLAFTIPFFLIFDFHHLFIYKLYLQKNFLAMNARGLSIVFTINVVCIWLMVMNIFDGLII